MIELRDTTKNPHRFMLRKISPAMLFALCNLGGLLLVLMSFILSRGELIDNYFFHDMRDTGMDFFHSIEYTRGRAPYERFNTLYPPLANLFFYGIYLMIPRSIVSGWTYDFEESVRMRGSDLDLRTYQAPALAYIAFVILCVVFLMVLVEYAMRKEKKWKAKIVAFASVLSYGSLWAFERGNIVLLSAILSIFFVLFYDSKNYVLKEISLIGLSIAAGLKLYPAVLGVLLFREKDWKAAMRAIVYGTASVVLPLFAFGGPSVLTNWLRVVNRFGNSSALKWQGTGIQQILTNVSMDASKYFNVKVPNQIISWVSCFVLVLLVVSVFFQHKKWHIALCATLIMLMYQPQADYALCMLLVPMVLMYVEEKQFTINNCIPIVGLIVLNVNIPVFYIRDEIYPRNTIMQMALIVLSIWCICMMLKNLDIFKRAKRCL